MIVTYIYTIYIYFFFPMQLYKQETLAMTWELQVYNRNKSIFSDITIHNDNWCNFKENKI